jgi:hypothetical protein
MTNVSIRIVLYIAGVLIAIGAIVGLTRSCDKRHNQAAQERVEDSQAGAATNSAADAIGTVQRSSEASAASEEMTRQNDRDIRAADGAAVKIGPGVDAAGRAALCRRAAYRNDPKCKGVK